VNQVESRISYEISANQARLYFRTTIRLVTLDVFWRKVTLEVVALHHLYSPGIGSNFMSPPPPSGNPDPSYTGAVEASTTTSSTSVESPDPSSRHPLATRPRSSRVRRYAAWAAGLIFVGFTLWYATTWYLWRRHFDAAQQLIARREFALADAQLEWCRRVWPSDPATWLASARVARRSGQFDQWTLRLRKADQRGARLGDIRLERLLGAAQQGLTPDLENLLQEQLGATRSDYAMIAEVLTGEYMRLYRLPDARAILNRWIELDGDDVEPWVRRAWVAEHQLDFDAAVADYRRVLAMDPTRLPVRLRVAEILFKIRKLDEAIAELEQLTNDQPGNVDGLLALSRCHRENGDFAAARKTLTLLPPGVAENPRCVAELGLVALGEERLEDAEQFLRQAIAKLPREREVLYGLQQTLSRLGKVAEAEEVQATLKQVDIDGRRMGEIVGGLAKTPHNAALRFEGAEIFLRNGVEEDGVRWLEMTLSADPRHIAAHQRLAEHYERRGQPDRARVHREAIRQIDEADLMSPLLRGRLTTPQPPSARPSAPATSSPGSP
jgi:tetratricopeptide (TPR) repeat protein